MTHRLPPEVVDRIEKEAREQFSHPDAQYGYKAGATPYAVENQALREKVERYEAALNKIARGNIPGPIISPPKPFQNRRR